MISAQMLRICREGKPASTFPDHALAPTSTTAWRGTFLRPAVTRSVSLALDPNDGQDQNSPWALAGSSNHR